MYTWVISTTNHTTNYLWIEYIVLVLIQLFVIYWCKDATIFLICTTCNINAPDTFFLTDILNSCLALLETGNVVWWGRLPLLLRTDPLHVCERFIDFADEFVPEQEEEQSC